MPIRPMKSTRSCRFSIKLGARSIALRPKDWTFIMLCSLFDCEIMTKQCNITLHDLSFAPDAGGAGVGACQHHVPAARP